jgi:hypothetical protein
VNDLEIRIRDAFEQRAAHTTISEPPLHDDVATLVPARARGTALRRVVTIAAGLVLVAGAAGALAIATGGDDGDQPTTAVTTASPGFDLPRGLLTDMALARVPAGLREDRPTDGRACSRFHFRRGQAVCDRLEGTLVRSYSARGSSSAKLNAPLGTVVVYGEPIDENDVDATAEYGLEVGNVVDRHDVTVRGHRARLIATSTIGDAPADADGYLLLWRERKAMVGVFVRTSVMTRDQLLATAAHVRVTHPAARLDLPLVLRGHGLTEPVYLKRPGSIVCVGEVAGRCLPPRGDGPVRLIHPNVAVGTASTAVARVRFVYDNHSTKDIAPVRVARLGVGLIADPQARLVLAYDRDGRLLQRIEVPSYDSYPLGAGTAGGITFRLYNFDADTMSCYWIYSNSDGVNFVCDGGFIDHHILGVSGTGLISGYLEHSVARVSVNGVDAQVVGRTDGSRVFVAPRGTQPVDVVAYDATGQAIEQHRVDCTNCPWP